jgi:hypothetical protein
MFPALERIIKTKRRNNWTMQLRVRYRARCSYFSIFKYFYWFGRLLYQLHFDPSEQEKALYGAFAMDGVVLYFWIFRLFNALEYCLEVINENAVNISGDRFIKKVFNPDKGYPA